MQKFTLLKGLVAPMDRANVDTDAIIPKQFLKSIRKTGFGPNLFDEWRYLDAGYPGQDPANPVRTIQTPFGKGQGAPIEPGRVANAQPQNQVQRRTNALTPDEQHKLQATMEKLKDNADLKEAREVALKARKSAEEATRKEHELTQDAALKLDPSLAPLFEKMHKAVAVQNQPQVRRGEQTPARREEPAR